MRLLSIATFVFLSLPSLHAAPITISPSGFIYLPCSVTGIKGNCLLDTGASDSSISNQAAKGLPRKIGFQVGALGGWPEIIFYYRVDDFEILGRKLPPKNIPSQRSFPFPEQPPDTLGVLGGDIMQGAVLGIDPISLSAEFLKTAPSGRCMAFASIAGSPDIELEGPQGKKLLALLDTASGITLLHPADALLARPEQGQGELGDATGKKKSVRLARISIRSFGKAETLRVAIPAHPFPKIGDRQIDLILGLNYLSKSPFVLDYRSRKFCIEN